MSFHKHLQVSNQSSQPCFSYREHSKIENNDRWGCFYLVGEWHLVKHFPKGYNGSSQLLIWITTCIPNCAQIVNNLGFIELSENQPDLVVCVSCSFETIACRYQKSLHFMFTFVYMNVIEFLKWGLLPYFNILIIIWVEDKIRNRK